MLEKLVFEINQPFGVFYVTKFKASELLKLAFSDPLRKNDEESIGIQRPLDSKRTAEIQDYIRSHDCAFPNSIILAANITPEGYAVDNEDSAWRLKEIENGTHDENILRIPQMLKMATIIDGQHRLYGFKEFGESDLVKYDTELLCSIYLELPASLQAYLFATINSNQRKVPKDIAYQLFGYDLESTSTELWSPDKVAISVARKLEDESILKGPVSVTGLSARSKFGLSLSAITDAILRLISTNPNKDKHLIADRSLKIKSRNALLELRKDDKAPLREFYLKSLDYSLFKVVSNFLIAAQKSLDSFANLKSALNKGIGWHGLLDALRVYLCHEKSTNRSLEEVDMTIEAFTKLLSKSKAVDFSADYYLRTTGVGRTRIRNTILYAYDKNLTPNLKEEDIIKIKQALGQS